MPSWRSARASRGVRAALGTAGKAMSPGNACRRAENWGSGIIRPGPDIVRLAITDVLKAGIRSWRMPKNGKWTR
jgi:hypothetical protein